MSVLAASPRIDTVLNIGSAGHLATHRLHPAQNQLGAEDRLRRQVDLDVLPDLDPRSRNNGQFPGQHFYFQIGPDNLLPLDRLAERCLLGKRTLAYIATPSPLHAWYVGQLRNHCARIAVEKPLTTDMSDARQVRDGGGHVFPVSHSLFKQGMIDTLADVNEMDLLGASGIEFNLLETDGVAKRNIDNSIFDNAAHGVAALLALARAANLSADITVQSAQIATYVPAFGEPAPRQFTAARIEGYLTLANLPLLFVIRVAKGCARSLKGLTIWGAAGKVHRAVSMTESGWKAHHRVMTELIAPEQPDMKITLADAVEVVGACTDACKITIDQGPYMFGTTPAFLLGGAVVGAAAAAAAASGDDAAAGATTSPATSAAAAA